MNLTPEQMNEAATALDERRACERCDGTGWLMGHDPNSAHPDNPDGEYDFDCPDCKGTGLANIDEFLRVLFAAWQEQTAAQAGKNPYPTTDAVYAVQHAAWARGAAAGVAASEKRVREALEDVREKASTLVASTLTTGLPAEEFIEDAYGVANALGALAALLSKGAA